MKNILLLLISLTILTGCDFDQEDPKFPSAPPSLMEACPSLKNMPPNTVKLSEALTVISDNYFQYHECRAKVDLWIEWYKLQKKIFETQ